jgi:NDP-sugar pyrophosphorylase family protein
VHTVDVRAIILVGGLEEAATRSDESFAGLPLAMHEVLGRTVVARVVDRLQAQGISAIAIVNESAVPDRLPKAVASSTAAPNGSFWRAAEAAFNDLAQAGAEAVLVIRMGGYCEFDTDEFLQRHLDARSHVTRAVDAAGSPLEMFLINASRRNDAAFLFRHHLQQTRALCGNWVFRGYTNPLADARDLRLLAVDGLMQRAQLKPAGDEVRPGVWIARGAQVDRRARVLAPAYVGQGARIRAGAVVTRCSAIEHHTEIDGGTVVENSTVLPYSYIGPGLDLVHTVAGSRRVVHLPRGVEVEINDPKLMDIRSQHAPLRVMASAASLASFLPVQFFRGLFAPSHRDQPKELPAAVQAPSAAIKTPAGFEGTESSSFPTNFAVARRYGDQ